MDRINNILKELDQEKPKKEKKVKEPEVLPEPEKVSEVIEKKVEPEKESLKKGNNLPDVRQVGGRRWKLLGLGGALIVVGLVGMVVYVMTLNMMAGFVGVIGWIAGGACGYIGWKPKDTGMVITIDGKPKVINANSMNIYPDYVEFEELPPDQLVGHPRKCINDNKYYYVNIESSAWGGEGGKLIPFKLPDTQYRDPREIANNLNIPANRELFKHHPTLFEKISPLILIGGIALVGLLWIIIP